MRSCCPGSSDDYSTSRCHALSLTTVTHIVALTASTLFAVYVTGLCSCDWSVLMLLVCAHVTGLCVRLMLETDCPFMHPEEMPRGAPPRTSCQQTSHAPCTEKKKGGKGKGNNKRLRCEPMHVRNVATTVAECLQLPVDQVTCCLLLLN